MSRKLYQIIASAIDARANCAKVGNTEWYDNHEMRADELTRKYMPHGSGFDRGTQIDWNKSDGVKRIVFVASYHHMNDGGYYDGWTDHTVIITPSFDGFDIRITGRDRDGWKDYAGDVFFEALSQEVKE